jgi:hypothetical protein
MTFINNTTTVRGRFRINKGDWQENLITDAGMFVLSMGRDFQFHVILGSSYIPNNIPTSITGDLVDKVELISSSSSKSTISSVYTMAVSSVYSAKEAVTIKSIGLGGEYEPNTTLISYAGLPEFTLTKGALFIVDYELILTYSTARLENSEVVVDLIYTNTDKFILTGSNAYPDNLYNRKVFSGDTLLYEGTSTPIPQDQKIRIRPEAITVGYTQQQVVAGTELTYINQNNLWLVEQQLQLWFINPPSNATRFEISYLPDPSGLRPTHPDMKITFKKPLDSTKYYKVLFRTLLTREYGKDPLFITEYTKGL